jgi:branched-chain amino acid transport system ATP-binding protein
MLRLSDVHASYGAAPVLHGVSLGVQKGETVALLGPNGAGKSTLLGAISGTTPRRRGRIDLEGSNLAERPSHAIVACGVALVPEGRLVFAPFTVQDNLRLGAVRLSGSLGERFDYVYGLFPRLAERRRQVAGTLSGGEQRMLSLARVLVRPPRLLVVDELSLGLAPIIIDEVYATLDRIRQEGTTLLLIEQYVGHALRLTDTVVLLQHGEVVYDGAATELGDVAERILTTSHD